MKDRTIKYLNRFFELHKELLPSKDNIIEICQVITNAYLLGGKLLICGNGGSCADSEHMVGELMKGFLLKRPLDQSIQEKFKQFYKEEGYYMGKNLQGALPTISLDAHTALITAIMNDNDPDLIYSQQVIAYGTEGDIVLGISTSGNAKNVYKAMMTAKVVGALAVGFTGLDGGNLAKITDYTFHAPAKETYLIQEYHVMVYHLLCMYVESEIYVY